MLALERWLHRVPAALVALIYGISVVSIFGLGTEGVHVVGEIPSGLAAPQIPDIDWAAVVALIPGGFAIVLVMFAEALGPARSFAVKHGYRIREDQELIGLGVANVGAGLFQGFPIGASLSKSAASDSAGGRTQVAGVVAAITTALVALFLTPLFANLPEATLGAIVIVAVFPMVHIGSLRRLYRVRKLDFLLAITALLGVLTFEDVSAGLLVAVMVSLIALIDRASRPQLSHLIRMPGTLNFRNAESHPEGLAIAGLLILRPDEGLFFANAGPLHELIRNRIDEQDHAVRRVLLDMSLTSETDVPGVAMLGALKVELDALDVELRLANVRSGLRELMEDSGVLEAVGDENIHGDVTSAALEFVRGSRGPVATSDIEAILERMSSLTDFMSRHESVLTDEQRSELADVFQELERLSRPSS
jgi:MFS superfamily sulfate permease-like transporter